MEFKINDETIFLIKHEDNIYKFENIHNVKIYRASMPTLIEKAKDIYFRTSKIVDNKIVFRSIFIKGVNLEEIKLEDNVYKIICEDASVNEEWIKNIDLRPAKRVRVTKEIAQQRMDDLGYEFDLIEWNGTSKPATIKCRECGKEITFKKGSSIYHKPNGTRGFGGFIGICNHYINKD
nr:MAG: hypothetical protein [Bacteriophage sp.]